MKRFISGFGKFMFMWVIGSLIFAALVALTKGSVSFYMLAPFVAIIWAMIGVIGADIEKRKKRNLHLNERRLHL